MKFLYALLALCLCLPLHAEVQVDEITLYSDWPADLLLVPGEFSCPGGTLPFCEDANRLHYRGTEIYSCMGGTVPIDPRVEGTVWIQINNNYDINGTGQGWGSFVLVPGDSCNKSSLINPEVYWEGSWQGRREIVSVDPMTWVHTINVVGHGVGGDLEGLKLRATEVLTLYTREAIPYEFLGLTGPESIVFAEIKSKVK
jgi:hypothetical protein